MKTRAQNNIRRWLAALVISLPLQMAQAELTIPGISGVAGVAGSDGNFAPTANVTLDLSLAKTAAWDAASSGNGVYDAAKWAVVYKFNSVNIPAGKTVSFKNHPSGAPVVWLVTGNATIAGVVNLNGEHGGGSRGRPSMPGPGGFAGGTGRETTSLIAGGGFGPGGAAGNYQDQGSYATSGTGDLPGNMYGNARILPLIGGSGGSGQSNDSNSGGAGGGALLLVVTGTLTVNGEVQALSGADWGASGQGSGGALRLIADTINGTGKVRATAWSSSGGEGRVRLETLNFTGNVLTFPSVPVLTPDDPLVLWPPAAAPSIRVVSVGAKNAPTDPRGSPQTAEIDFQLDNETSSNIVLEAKNVQSDASVKVRIVPVYGLPITQTATFSNGTTALSTWTVNNVALPQGAFVVQAHAVNP